MTTDHPTVEGVPMPPVLDDDLPAGFDPDELDDDADEVTA